MAGHCGEIVNLVTLQQVFTVFSNKFPSSVMDPSCQPVTQLVRFLLEADIDFLPTEQDVN